MPPLVLSGGTLEDEKDHHHHHHQEAKLFSSLKKEDNTTKVMGARRCDVHRTMMMILHHHPREDDKKRMMVFVPNGGRRADDDPTTRRGGLQEDDEDDDDDATTTEDALEVLANGVTPLVFATHNKGGKDWMNAFGGHNKGVSSNASTTDETNTNDLTEEKEEYVQKEFDLAMLAAQNALKAKTAANRRVHVQAKAAMHNAVTALKLTEKECQRPRRTGRREARSGWCHESANRRRETRRPRTTPRGKR